MLGVTVFIVSTLVFNTHGQKNNEKDNNINWAIKRTPIVFGEDAVLFCNLSSTDNCCTNTVTWMKNFDVVLHHGASTNSSKYQQIQENDGFSLVIKHFDEKDINCQYTCLYGFDTYSSILRINPNDFELRPTNETTKYTINAKQLEVDVNFGKVFPSPQCKIMMNENILKSKSVANESTNGLFLSSHIKLICELQLDNCSGNIIVQCLVGKTHVMTTTILPDCTNLDATFKDIGHTIMKVVLGITVFLAIVIAVLVIIYRKNLLSRPYCCLDVEGECFNKQHWVPAQRSKDVIKLLQVVFCERLLQLAATNLRINQIRKNIWMLIVKYTSDMCSSIGRKILYSKKRKDLLSIIKHTITTDYINMLKTACNIKINEARMFVWMTRNELDSLYNRRYADVLQKMAENRLETAENDLMLNVSNIANKSPRLKLKEMCNGDSCCIGKKLFSKKKKDINLLIDFALRGNETDMLVTASNNRINLARSLLWKERNQIDSEYRDVQVGISVQRGPIRNDGPPISTFNKIKHDMDLINAIGTSTKTNDVYCLLMADNIRINKARMKTSSNENESSINEY